MADQELPCLARAGVGQVEADVRAPYDRHAGVLQPRDHARRLGVVQENDVVGLQALGHELRVGRATLVVSRALRVAQRATVAAVAVQTVVQALGDREELGVAGDNHPTGVETRATGVADE